LGSLTETPTAPVSGRRHRGPSVREGGGGGKRE